jgi:CHAD domain-containing protein
MTTNRTAIGRRLAVRGSAHRPPWGGRKAAHRSIVAPLAASVAASLAVGVGMALARAERDRRSAGRRRAAELQFALLPGEAPVLGLRRIALGQLDLAIGLLGGGGDGTPPDERAVHETRKALKRLRALARVLRAQLGEERFARENAALRDAGRRLAGARDAEVLVATLDGLLERHPGKLGRRGGVARLREALVAEREAATAQALGDAALRAEVIAELQAVRGRVMVWPLGNPAGIEALEPGLLRLYRQGRRRYLAAASSNGKRETAMHEWRKRVKDLRHAAEMLERREPGERKRAKRRSGGRGRAAAARRIRRLARTADRLAEALGEEHDLSLLAQRVRSQGRRGGAGRSASGGPRVGRRSRRALLKQIARRRRRLRETTLRDGARLYRRGPRAFTRRLLRAHERASRGQG